MYICLQLIHKSSPLFLPLSYFRTEESKESLLAIPVGNVTAQTELTYEYGVRRKGRKEKKESEKAGGEQKRS